MSAHANPDIIDDGLVFLYDTDDGKSFKGEPTVNLVGAMTKSFSSWSGLTGSTEYYTTSTGGQGVKLITTSSGGVRWYVSSTIYNIQASTQYTISATVKYTGGTPHPNLLYVRQYDGNGQTSESGKFTTANVRDLGGGWKRIWRTFTTDSTTTHINLQGYEYTTGKTIYIQDLQFELKSHATQFAGVSTTRSATQGLIDRTGTSTINISNASFDSNAQMTFDGTDDHVSLGNPTALRDLTAGTIETVYYRDASSGTYQMIFTDAGSDLEINYSANVLQFYIGNSGLSYTHAVTDQWFNVVGTWGASFKKLYINGVQVASGGNTGTDTGSRDRFVGGRGANFPFNGEIPIAKVYNRTLTAAEVLQNFNATKSRFGL
jgi:hypothetical protein